MRTGLAIICALTAVSCGGASPTSPSAVGVSLPAASAPPSSWTVAGAWIGTLSRTINGVPSTFTVTARLTDHGGTVTGVWQARDSAGDFTFERSNGVLSGSTTLDLPSNQTQARCHGAAAVTGTVSPLVLHAPAVSVTGCEGVVADMTGTLSPQVR